MKCVYCNNYTLSYQQKRLLTPKVFQFTPASVECPKCQEQLGSTEVSRALCVLSLIATLLACMIALGGSAENISMPMVSFIVVICYSINNYFLWPKLIRIKKWQTLSDSLPKSRLVGYLIFFVLPVCFIIGLLYLGVYFESN